MTEQISDQISAFIDDELPDEESAFLLRRLERDSDARNRAMRYTLIGAALREELLPVQTILRRRIAVALTGAASPPQRTAARWRSRYLRPALGVGIAASVAIAAIFGLRVLNDARLGGAGPAVAPLQTRSADQSPSYVVPQEVADAPAIQPAVRLTNYIVHHSEYASRLSRTSVRSNVIGAAELVPVVDPQAQPEQQPAVKRDPAAE